jgi:phenylalanyl-tRNA synthetase beta chain
LTYSFISQNLIEKVGQDPKNSYKIINSLSPDLQYIRQQLIPSLLEKVHPNQKSGFNHFALFEMNQVYLKSQGLTDEKVPKTLNNLALIITGDFYAAKKYLSTLGSTFILKPTKPTKPSRNEAYFEPKRSASIYLGDTHIGIIGEIKNSVKAALKLPNQIAAFELALEPFLDLPFASTTFKISEFPLVSRDLTLTVPETTPYEKIINHLHQQLTKAGLIYQISPGSIYQPASKTTKNLTFHLEFTHPDKTLDSTAISDIVKTLS